MFNIKFSVDSCYFFIILKQKIQKSLIITTKTCTRIHIFQCIYLDGENDSDDAVKTKMLNFSWFFRMIFPFLGNARNRLRASKILKKFSGGQKMEKIASKLGVISFNPNTLEKFFRIFRCAQSIPRIKLLLKVHLLKKFSTRP